MATHKAQPLKECWFWQTDRASYEACEFIRECGRLAVVCTSRLGSGIGVHLCAPCYRETFEDSD